MVPHSLHHHLERVLRRPGSTVGWAPGRPVDIRSALITQSRDPGGGPWPQFSSIRKEDKSLCGSSSVRRTADGEAQRSSPGGSVQVDFCFLPQRPVTLMDYLMSLSIIFLSGNAHYYFLPYRVTMAITGGGAVFFNISGCYVWVWNAYYGPVCWRRGAAWR